MAVVVGVDIETNSLDRNTGEVIELGYVVYETKSHKVMALADDLIKGPVIDQKTTELTGITQDQLERFGEYPGWALTRFVGTVIRSEAVAYVAHNGIEFDFPYLTAWAKRIDRAIEIPELPVIDTRLDIAYPKEVKSRKQRDICAVLGIENPFAHRAVFDVLAMLQILDHFDFDAIHEVSINSELVYIKPVGRVDNATLKAHGFYFKDGLQWARLIRAANFPHEKEVLPFDIDLL